MANVTSLEQLYVAYFNRPADVAGLSYWGSVVDAAPDAATGLAQMAKAFAASAEYKAAYANMDNGHIVAAIYQNLFGHAPDPSGLVFYTNGLNSGALTIDKAVTTIYGGAQGTDQTVFSNKVTAATTFTQSLQSTAQILGYSGPAANAVASNYLSGVTDVSSLNAAITPAALANVSNSMARAAS
jgi:hypothetical protein